MGYQKILITYKRTKKGEVEKFITVVSCLPSDEDWATDIVSDLIQDYCGGVHPYWHRFEKI